MNRGSCAAISTVTWKVCENFCMRNFNAAPENEEEPEAPPPTGPGQGPGTGTPPNSINRVAVTESGNPIYVTHSPDCKITATVCR